MNPISRSAQQFITAIISKINISVIAFCVRIEVSLKIIKIYTLKISI